MEVILLKRMVRAADLAIGDVIFPYDMPAVVIANLCGVEEQARIIVWGHPVNSRVTLPDGTRCLAILLIDLLALAAAAQLEMPKPEAIIFDT